MNMSEFEEPLPDKDGPEDSLSHFSIHSRSLPDDFSEEEIAFARELEGLLIPEQEEAPPYYVQSLLEPEDQRFQAVEPGFEKKVSVRVFRRLKLPRRLYRSHNSPFQAVMKTLSLSRSLLIAACLLLMCLSMLATGPAFASGLAILLSAGKHSGVMLVKGHPSITSNGDQQIARSSPDKDPAPQHMNLVEAQYHMNFSMYLPTSDTIPSRYTLKRLYLYNDPNQSWADGPIFEMNYQYTSPGVMPQDPGRGKITIYEFKPVGKVFQAVMSGAAHQIKDASGHTYAIYVDGQWARINQSYRWQYGERNELIYERDGVVFWIAADQRDGIDGDALLSIANSLHIFNAVYASRMGGHFNDVTTSYDGAPQVFANDIIYIDNNDGLWQTVEADPSAQSDTIGIN